MAKRNVICIPFAFKEGANSGINVKKNAYDTYLKNACVALCSAKHYNPNCEVVFATNIRKEEIPEQYISTFEEFGVSVLEIPFENFVFPNEYLWSLAFYKLCVLKYLSKKDYDCICYMDTDVYVQGSFDNIWNECDKSVLLYDINHGLSVKDYQIICEEMSLFRGDKEYITHFGGEFFAASNKHARKFVEILECIYQKMMATGFVTTKGDEFIVSLAAHEMKDRVKNAGAYIYRFWTSARFRLVSTCYEYNPVTVLHMPNEKNRGILKIYNSYIKKGKIPKNKSVWRKCNLYSPAFMDICKRVVIKTIRC